MRTVSFKSLLHGIASMMGLDPERDLTVELAAAYTEFINNRVREGHEWDFWPETMLVEQRTYRKIWNGTDAFTTGTEVFNDEDDLYYIALANSTNVRPDTDASKWAVQTALNRYVPLTPFESAEGTIWQVMGAYRRDPRQTAAPGRVGFWISKDGIQFGSDAPARPWINYRTAAPVFSSRVWNETEANVAGDRRYLPATGECYLAKRSSTGANPASSPDDWGVISMPYVYALFVKLSAYADALADDGQMDKAEKVRGETDNPRPGTAYYELQRAQDVEMAGQQQVTFAMR